LAKENETRFNLGANYAPCRQLVNAWLDLSADYSTFLRFKYCRRLNQFVLLLRVVSFPFATVRLPGKRAVGAGLRGFLCFDWHCHSHGSNGESVCVSEYLR